MRRLTKYDLAKIIDSTVKGYIIDDARVKDGEFSDSDHYGILLGRSKSGNYVTWQFHLEDEEPSVYWGHYFMEDRDAAIKDFNTRK